MIGQCLPRHRHEEFLKFLRTIDNQVPKHLAVHLILDNYATHNHADVQTWLDRHQRFHLHFTPTSSSWLNLVERWFRELTEAAWEPAGSPHAVKVHDFADKALGKVAPYGVRPRNPSRSKAGR